MARDAAATTAGAGAGLSVIERAAIFGAPGHTPRTFGSQRAEPAKPIRQGYGPEPEGHPLSGTGSEFGSEIGSPVGSLRDRGAGSVQVIPNPKGHSKS